MNYRIGVDIGATTFKIGILDEQFRIVKRTSMKPRDTFADSIRALSELVTELAGQSGLKITDFPCLGVGVPCAVIPDTGQLILAHNLGWKDDNIRDELSRYISIPLYFGNDANCAVWGETIAGAAKGRKHVIMLTLGTGVGSGIVIDGKLFTGGDGLGPEVGHLPLIYEGLPCSCGLNGCLESYASATALISQTKEAIAKNPSSSMARWEQEHGEITGRTAFDCAKEGDETALAVIDQYTSYLAGALGGLVNIFRPEIILLGGGISNAGDFLMDRVNAKLPRYTLACDLIGTAPVQRAILGNDAGIIGAAYLDQMR